MHDNPLLDFNGLINVVHMKPCRLAYLQALRNIELELTIVLCFVLTGAIDGDLPVSNQRPIPRSLYPCF
jgi:hypothetical protein